MRRIALLALTLAVFHNWGCAAVTPLAAKADEAASQGSFDKADDLYRRAMRQPLAGDEYEYIIERRCQVRGEIIDARLTEMERSTPTLEAIDELREYILKCPNFPAYDERLINITSRSVGASLDSWSDEAQSRPWTVLQRTRDYAERLPESHPLADWEGAVRDDWNAEFERRSSAFEEDSSAAKVLNSLQARMRLEPARSLREEPRYRQVAPASAVGPESCRNTLSRLELAAEEAFAGALEFDVANLEIVGCSRNVATEDYIDVETRDREEEREVQKQAARAAGDEATALEVVAHRWLNGLSLTDSEAAALAQLAQLERLPPSPDGLPDLEAPAWYAADSVVKLEFESPPHDTTGVLQFGFPLIHGSMGTVYRSAPTDLVGQPDRSALSFIFDGNFRYGLTTSDYGRGLGLLGGVDFSVSVGRRFGDDYQRTEELPIFAGELDRQLETTRAFGMSLSALGLTGYRGRRLGLFAGSVPPSQASASVASTPKGRLCRS